MLVVPIQTSETDFDLIVILEAENIGRMQEYDPAEVDIGKMRRSRFDQLKLRKIRICCGSVEEVKTIMEAVQAGRDGDLMQQLNNLWRGWQFRPDLGDSDVPFYPSLRRPS